MSRRGSQDRVVPAGLVVEKIEAAAGQVVIVGRSCWPSSRCPNCRRPSTHVHSRYRRTLADLPSHGRVVRIELCARRFRCRTPNCRRRIFAERFAEEVAPVSARRTARLERIVYHLGLALGGRPAAGLARRLLLPVSKDTLLRSVRRHASVGASTAPVIVGIDDWAWKRGQRYGSIVVDLERGCVVDLLADREAATIEAWLRAHPEIRIVARDRGGGYGHAITRVRPDIRQVADRWHLMENASQAFLAAVRGAMRPIREAMDAGDIDPMLLTCAERLQYEGFLRRQEADRAIRVLADAGASIKAIVRATGYSRKLVRQVVRGGQADVFRVRTSSLEPWLPLLDREWSAGCRNGAELWRRLRRAGFRGSLRVVGEWATRRRRAEAPSNGAIRKCPSARVIARLLTTERDRLSRQEAVVVAVIEQAVPALVLARDLIDRFQDMIRRKQDDDLGPWIERATGTDLASFAKGLRADYAAVAAALVEPWSNGRTEGHITRLKLVKRQMYGRAKLDLLRTRLLQPA